MKQVRAKFFVEDIRHSDIPGTEQYASISMRPVFGTYGNSGRAIFRLPGRNQTNLSLIKNFYFNQEKGRYLQFRVESFNVFNHTQFFIDGNGNQIGTSTYGRPGSTRLPREFQFGLKIYF